MHKLSLALAGTMNRELKLGLDWSRSSMDLGPGDWASWCREGCQIVHYSLYKKEAM
jgi:hypothetical protein